MVRFLLLDIKDGGFLLFTSALKVLRLNSMRIKWICYESF
jgi:hypothetical protein